MDFVTGRTNALPVMVEYEFFNVRSSCLGQLPERVTQAVRTLVRRQRVPSDEDVRQLVQETNAEGGNEEEEEQRLLSSAASVDVDPADAFAVAPARVRVMVPHNVAVELALHRSFQEGGNVEQRSALTAAELRALHRRSQLIRLRRLRAQQEQSQSLQSARVPPARGRISPAVSTCVIC